jgi:1,4-alpha-glucan branching enzyme
MIAKQLVKKKGMAKVTFELPMSIMADRVNVVGDFNDWDTTATPMTLDRTTAVWKATIELRADRSYRFRYLIDGREWLNDWFADDHVENQYGSYDSVVDLTELVSC